jgi:cysteine desulfuration protein SufE
MMSLAQRQAESIQELNLLPDAHERLAALSSYVKPMLLPEPERLPERIVAGCQTQVWVHGQLDADGTCHFRAAASSPIVASLVAALCQFYEGGTPLEVLETEPELWTGTGLVKILSPTRLHGLSAVRARLCLLARNWLPDVA